MNEIFYNEVFEATALTASSWALTAHRLKHAGDLLYEAYRQELKQMVSGPSLVSLDNISLVTSATLLIGLAFENILKAIIVQNEPNIIENGKLKKWPSSGHNQLQLAQKARLDLDDTERDVLNRLSSFVVWAGRYPIPRSSDDFAIIQLAEPDKFVPIPIEHDEKSRVDNLFKKLESEVIQ